MDTTYLINIIHDITSLVIYLLLLLSTILYIIFYRKKNVKLSIKEKINFNLIFAYIIFSIMKIIVSMFNLFTKAFEIFRLINIVFPCILIVCYCFYIYMFSSSIQIPNESHFIFYSIMFWLIGIIVYFVSFIMIRMKITEFTIPSVIMLTIVIGLQLVTYTVLLIKIISLIIVYNRLLKEYQQNTVEQEKEKFNNKHKVIFICIMMILNIVLNLGYFLNSMVQMILSLNNVEYKSFVDIIGKFVLLFTNSINHILVLLIFIYDENIYEKILCKKTSDNVNNDHEQMNVEFFIN